MAKKLTRGTRADLICIVILLLLNPATWYLGKGPENVFPDSAAYLAMGANLFSSGLAWLPSWGHVDVGLILPPLYPLLIAAGKLFTGDALVAARLLSTLFMLLSSVLGFLFLRRMSHRAVAVCAVLLIQLNASYLSLALTPLTEPLFIAATLGALLLWLRLLENPQRWALLCPLLGVATALAYFSRQVGLVVVVFFILFTLAHGLAAMRGRWQEAFTRTLLVAAGAALLIVPYVLVVRAQTGYWPSEQRFRMGEYTVTATDRDVVLEVEELRSWEAPDYDTLYAKRRAWMRLIPDGSEMVAYVMLEGDAADSEAAIPELRLPKQTGTRFAANVRFLTDIVGVFVAGLFLVTAVLALLGRNRPKPFFTRAALPLLILFYILSISLVTGLVERYLLVVFPLVILQIFTELYAFIGMLGEKPGIKGLREGILALILAGGLVATPALYDDVELRPWLSESNAPLNEFRQFTSPEDPVISIVPQFAYYIGGTFRYLPNDTLDKVAAYARDTGVKWLLVSRDLDSLAEAELFTDAGWFRQGRPDLTHPELLRFVARSADGGGYLFEIRR